MKKIIAGVATISMFVQVAYSAVIVQDTFDQDKLDAKVWNDGTGFVHDQAAANVKLSTSGTSWGSKGDKTGAAGLDTAVGSASFTVAQDGTNPIGGNFIVGTDKYSDTASALVRIDLSTGGAGEYEVVWNNSGAEVTFKMASGWAGTVAGNSFVWIVDGKTDKPHWGTTDGAANVTVGDAAGRFGFWIAEAGSSAIIDDLTIVDTPAMSK